jgi:TonB-dependent receptor
MTLVSHCVRRGLVAASLFGLSAGWLTAGDIFGVVADAASRGTLSGAVVTLAETGRSTTTGSGGSFSFTGLPEGTYTLQVRYLGYDTRVESVSVPASGAVPVTVRMGDDVVALAAFLVEGYREGRSRALQQKQNQTNISDLISADSIGNLPDRNVAEAVARLPGVSLSLEQGEGRYVSIRGVEPNLNQVMIDGAIAAAPGGTRLGRAVPLDTLGSGQVSQIEVVKSVTPDLDANSLGGTLKITTASPFDRPGRFASGMLAVNQNESTDKRNLEARVSYSDRFGGDKWGIAVGASYDKRDYSNHWLQVGGWNLRNINGTDIYIPNGLEIKPEEGDQERYGGNLTLEFRPNADTQFYFRPNFSKTSRFEHTVEVLHSVDNAANRVTLLTPTSARFDGTRTRTERRDFRSLREQDLFSLATGFKKVIGNFILEPMFTYSTATEDRVYDNILAFRNNNGGTGPITIDWTGFDFTSLTVDPAIDVPSKYPLRRTREDYGIVEEDTLTAKVDVTWDLESHFDRPAFLKSGFKYTQRDRVTDLESYRLVPVGNWNLGAIGTLPGVPVYGGRFDSGFLIDHDTAFSYIRNNPALTVFDPVDSAANSIEDDYQIDEYIYAAFAMGSVTFNRLTLLGGLRWEKTDATIRAVEARFAGNTLLGRFPTSGSTSYDKLFPNLQGVFRFNERLVARAAITRTIGRPAYEDARPLSNFRFDALGGAALDPVNFPYSGSLSIGNPQLGPYDAMNYDLSLEWYARGSGIISIAYFRKEVDDPIYTYSETQERVVYNGIGLQTLNLTSRRNADEGRIAGVEFNIYQPFSFLPAPFDGFGIDMNLTQISSDVSIPTRVGADLPFFRQPESIANVTLFYDRGRFSGRIAWNRVDEQLYTLGSNTLNDVFRLPREQYDLQLRYRISDHFAISASVRNLTREKEQFRYGVPGLLRITRLLERDYKIGVEFNF